MRFVGKKPQPLPCLSILLHAVIWAVTAGNTRAIRRVSLFRNQDETTSLRGSSHSTADSSRFLQAGGGCLPMNTGALFKIVARHSGKALHVDFDSKEEGARLIQRSIDTALSYKWRFVKSSSGHYRIVNDHTKLEIRVKNGATEDGKQMKLYAVSDKLEGNWCFQDAGTESGYYKIEVQHNPNYVMNVKISSHDNGAAIQQWPYIGSDNQQWIVTLAGDDTSCVKFDSSLLYHIKPRHSMKGLAVSGDYMSDGVEVVQKTIDGRSKSTEWKLHEVAGKRGYYRIVNDNSDKDIRVVNGLPTPQTKIVQWTAGTRMHGNWCFRHIEGTFYKIVVEHSEQVLSVTASSKSDGAGVHQNHYHGGQNQQWLITEVLASSSGSGSGGESGDFVEGTDSGEGGGVHNSGMWEGPFPMPIIPVAAGNLDDGRIITWSSAFKYAYGGAGKTFTAIFDPSTKKAPLLRVENTNHDMFCPGTAVLPDKRILITGGQDSIASTIYDPTKDIWYKGKELNIPRGYQSMTVLSDGSVFMLGGSFTGDLGKDKDGEVWDPKTGSWTLRPGIRSFGDLLTDDLDGQYRSDNHMWLFLAPNNKVFHAGPSRIMHWIDTNGDGKVTKAVTRGDDQDAMNGNAVMFDIGKILVVGGAPHYVSTVDRSSERSYVIDINGGIGNVIVKETGKLRSGPRTLGNSVVLPSGEVFVVGGLPMAMIFSDDNAIMVPEMWNPKSEKFTTLAKMAVPRTYHSVAILMKDGRVFVGGGGLCAECSVNHADVEIYTPPYLLSADGTRKRRPEILSEPPQTVKVGETFSIGLDTNQAHTFALLRLGAVTHSVNNDARRIPISGKYKYTSDGIHYFNLKVPDNPAVALPGSYFLFAMNINGVPSWSQVVSIKA